MLPSCLKAVCVSVLQLKFVHALLGTPQNARLLENQLLYPLHALRK